MGTFPQGLQAGFGQIAAPQNVFANQTHTQLTSDWY
jgi:hypothetical protein